MMISLKNKIETLEREEITRALQECNWVKAQAAKYLGITERMIGYKIKKYRIKRPPYRIAGFREDLLRRVGQDNSGSG
jgi:Nif-specific regulatory protein